jgi:hypothetical protein
MDSVHGNCHSHEYRRQDGISTPSSRSFVFECFKDNPSLIIWVVLALIVRALGVRVVALPSFLTVERLLKHHTLTPVANFSGRFLDLSVQFVKGSAICFSTVSQTLLVILLLVLSVGF